ncbi:MAG: hypothetical protein IKA82_02165 [Clostridia bacterium]|nr:hypothetical protein [Clostridia bacterium]
MIKYREYRTAVSLTEYLLTVSDVDSARIGELCEVISNNSAEPQYATVIALDGRAAMLRLHGSAKSLSLENVCVRFTGRTPTLAVSQSMLGRCFNGFGEVADNGPRIICGKKAEVYTPPISPAEKSCPTEMLSTGLSAIDVISPILKGQKMAIFSGHGILYENLLVRISKSHGNSTSAPIIIFAGIGLNDRTVEMIDHAVVQMGILDRTVRIVSRANEPLPELLATPHTAMTVAEYFALEHGADVIVLMTDMASYAEVHRTVAIDAGEAMASNGYPVTLSPDLAAIAERAGVYRKNNGSVTLIAAMTADTSTPVAEILRRVTDSRITLSSELYKHGVNPPIDPLHSFSALRKNAKNAPVDTVTAEKLLARYAEAVSGTDSQFGFAKTVLDKLVSQDMRSFRQPEQIAGIVEALMSME